MTKYWPQQVQHKWQWFQANANLIKNENGRRKFKSLENLQVHYYGVHEIIFKLEDWLTSTCICMSFLEKFACKQYFIFQC